MVLCPQDGLLSSMNKHKAVSFVSSMFDDAVCSKD